MINNNEITVILPLHTWNETIESKINDAIGSVPSDINIIISASKTLKDIDQKKIKREDVVWVFADGEMSNFQYLTNEGVKSVETEWFSILEFDDTYSPIWFDCFKRYQEYHQEFNFFYPLVDLYDVSGGDDDKFAGNGNEAPWAASFSEEIGIIDEKSLDNYFSYYPTGGMFKKDVWDEIGGLKDNIKLTFWYEFMLRAVKNNEKFYVVPKIGYIHELGRIGSLLQQYRDGITKEESEFWFKTAKKESYYKAKRDVSYVPKETKSKKD